MKMETFGISKKRTLLLADLLTFFANFEKGSWTSTTSLTFFFLFSRFLKNKAACISNLLKELVKSNSEVIVEVKNLRLKICEL